MSLLGDLWQDLRHALRGLRRNPGFAAVAVGTVALGIGANATMFSVAYGLLFRPLPVKDPTTLKNIYLNVRTPDPTATPRTHRSTFASPYFSTFSEFEHMRVRGRTAELAGVSEADLSWKEAIHGELHAQLVSDNLLPMIGARPALGRFFTPQETSQAGSAPVVVLTYRAWQTYFGGEQDVVNRVLTLNRTPFTVIGVADEQTEGPLLLKPDVWIPITMQALTSPGESLIDDPTAAWVQIFARARPGFTGSEVRAEIQVLAEQALTEHNPEKIVTVSVTDAAFLNTPDVREAMTPIVALLFAPMGLVLLAACANVANMLVARGITRGREISVRLALGAGKGRLLRQLLVESLLLGVAGGAAGLYLAQFAGPAVGSVLPQEGPHQLDTTADPRILAFTLGISLVTAVIFGSGPALRSLRGSLVSSLRASGATAGSRVQRMWLQHGMISVQVAVCLVLLVTAGLLLRGFQSGLQMDLGRRTHGVLSVKTGLRQGQYTPERAEQLITDLRRAAATIPAVESASYAMFADLNSGCSSMASIVQPDGAPGETFRVRCEAIGPDFFRTEGIRVLEGVPFTEADMRREGLVIIDEALARRYFPEGSPLGRKIQCFEQDCEVVAVVASTRELSLGGSTAPMIYTPLRESRFADATLVVSYAGQAAPVMRGLEHLIAQRDPELRSEIVPIEQQVETALNPVRVAALVSSTLGAFTIVLACSGIFGLVSFAVSRRRREIGIRVALGAQRRDVLRLVAFQGMKPVLAGMAFGLALAAGAGLVLRAELYGVSPLDPLTFSLAPLLLAAVAALAALIPARAAARIEPAQTLRND